MPAPAACHAPTASLRCGNSFHSRPRCLSTQLQRPVAAVAARRQAGAAALRCRAAADKEGQGGSMQQQEGKPVVPDTPPTPSGATAQAQQAESSSPAQPATMSVEEIQQRAAALRQQKAAAAAGAAKEGLVEGVTEEIRLIKWPAPVKAALNTLLVIGIVAGTAGMLLAINSLLTNISDVIY